MKAYLTLDAFPEAPTAFRALGATPLAVLSTGSPLVLERAVRSSGLEGAFRTRSRWTR